MTGAFSPVTWHDPMPLLVLGTGVALPSEAIATEELLTAVDRRFGLSLRRRGEAMLTSSGSARTICVAT